MLTHLHFAAADHHGLATDWRCRTSLTVNHQCCFEDPTRIVTTDCSMHPWLTTSVTAEQLWKSG
jgi:hypothetical protein